MTGSRGAVLVVDDDPDIREIVAIFLQLRGIEALVAEDGVEALAILRGPRKVGLVLLDLMMPRMNGADLLREIRRDPDLAGLPVAVISGNCEARSLVMGLGADACVAKPVEIDDLERLVDRFLKKEAAGA